MTEIDEKISSVVASINTAKFKIKENKNKIDKILDENSEYVGCEVKIKSIQDLKKNIKKELFRTNKELSALRSESRDYSQIKKMHQISLSEYLEEFQKTTGEKLYKGKMIVTIKKLA